MVLAHPEGGAGRGAEALPAGARRQLDRVGAAGEPADLLALQPDAVAPAALRELPGGGDQALALVDAHAQDLRALGQLGADAQAAAAQPGTRDAGPDADRAQCELRAGRAQGDDLARAGQRDRRRELRRDRVAERGDGAGVAGRVDRDRLDRLAVVDRELAGGLRVFVGRVGAVGGEADRLVGVVAVQDDRLRARVGPGGEAR